MKSSDSDQDPDWWRAYVRQRPGTRSRIQQIFEDGDLSAVVVHEKRVPLSDGLVGAALRFEEEELRDRGLQLEGGAVGLTQWSKLLMVYQVSVTQRMHRHPFYFEPASEHVFV